MLGLEREPKLGRRMDSSSLVGFRAIQDLVFQLIAWCLCLLPYSLDLFSPVIPLTTLMLYVVFIDGIRLCI